MPNAYLDHNASGPLRPEARAAMLAALDLRGNASSVHADGRAARGLVEAARADVAGLVGTAPADVTFTSGGTEAAALALAPHPLAGGARPVRRLLIAAGEHPCVLDGHRFPREAVKILPLLQDGQLDLDALRAELARGGGPALVALQAANNETGVIQPVAEAAALARAAGGALICDAVQAAGRIVCDLKALGAAALILSAHKFGGPKGAGALVIDPAQLHIGEALVRGGGQERGRRAGTENVAAIAGFGAAAQAAGRDLGGEAARLAGLRDAMEARLLGRFGDLAIFGKGVERLPNTSCFALPGLSAETLLMALDLAGFSVSSGSACSSGKVKPSHVLLAMGVAPDLAKGALRVSLGWDTKAEDTEGLCGALEKAVSSIHARRQRAIV